MAASIRDVAKAAGVSIATVSRIINNSANISPETREKTLKVMKELNYVPNSLARGLSNMKALNVALLIDIEDVKSFSNPFFYEVMHGIETVVYKHGLCLVIASAKKTDDKIETLDRLVYGKVIQGVFIPSSLANENIINQLNEINFPFVIIGEPSENKESLNWADINNHHGGWQAIEHLLEKGYKKIAFIGGKKDEMFNKYRLLGYKEALEKYNISVNEKYIKECDGKEQAYNSMKELIRMDKKIDAVICGDNILSYGAMKAIKEAKLKIPDDMGLISFDDYPLAELVEPSITTVDIDVFELGIKVANILIESINNSDEKQQKLIGTSIKPRESTQR